MSVTAVRRQFIRYAAVGLASNLFCYLAYLGLTRLGLESKLAMSMLYGAGVLQTFAFNKRWTFEHGGAHGSVFFRFCVAYSLGYLLNISMLYILVDQLGYPHELIQGGMIVSIAMMLFLAQKYWVFRTE